MPEGHRQGGMGLQIHSSPAVGRCWALPRQTLVFPARGRTGTQFPSAGGPRCDCAWDGWSSCLWDGASHHPAVPPLCARKPGRQSGWPGTGGWGLGEGVSVLLRWVGISTINPREEDGYTTGKMNRGCGKGSGIR